MRLKINNVIYDNRAPYEDEGNAGNDYKLMNKHLIELGYGAFNCNDLFEFWNELSDKYAACWLIVPENIEDFKALIGYYNKEKEDW